jgi:hypothetical protein
VILPEEGGGRISCLISWLEERWPGGGKKPEEDNSAEEEREEGGKNPEEVNPEEDRLASRSCIKVVWKSERGQERGGMEGQKKNIVKVETENEEEEGSKRKG